MERILDLGIGAGGRYILKDTPDTKRVCVDKSQYGLSGCVRDYGIDTVLLDLRSTGHQLPFRDDVFTSADIILPQDDLRVALASNWDLWPELKRVVKKNGSVEIITDVPENGEVYEGIFRISNPHLRFARYAEASGFVVQMSKIDRSETAELGTYYSEGILPYQDIKPNPNLLYQPVTMYKLIALNTGK